jgi:hypothetical protein
MEKGERCRKCNRKLDPISYDPIKAEWQLGCGVCLVKAFKRQMRVLEKLLGKYDGAKRDRDGCE